MKDFLVFVRNIVTAEPISYLDFNERPSFFKKKGIEMKIVAEIVLFLKNHLKLLDGGKREWNSKTREKKTPCLDLSSLQSMHPNQKQEMKRTQVVSVSVYPI